MEFERNKVICIYHSPCADGFGAAWVVNEYFKQHAQLTDVFFVAGTYGMEPPDVEDAYVIIVDFSFSRETLIEMGKSAKQVLVIDHHKTAEAELMGFPAPAGDVRKHTTLTGRVQCLFDMDRSGAVMTWEFFFPTVEIPTLLLHIQDRDLWRFEMTGTKEVMAAVFTREYDFEVWRRIMGADMGSLKREGGFLLSSHMKNIRDHIDRSIAEVTLCVPVEWGFESSTVLVPCLNAPAIWASDAGHLMCKDHPSKMAVIWIADKGQITVSLRSAEDGPDVSQIARTHGGGGHKHAAGYKIDRDIGPWW